VAPAGREVGDDAQAVAGLGQVPRTMRPGCGPSPRTVVDDRDAGRGAAPPDQDLEPAALAGAGVLDALLASSDTPSTASSAAGHPASARATNRRACLTWSG
jgi:hypothetical protein